MDELETSSNICGGSSTSNLSSISGLTGYEEEINEIRSLIELSSSKQKPPKPHHDFKDNADSFSYEIRISNLSSELQNVLKLNEKYKNDLFNLQRQQDLQYHEKFEKLLRKSSFLEAQLENANAHIRNLKRPNKTVQADDIEDKVLKLENQNYNLKSRVSEFQSESDSWKNELNSLQSSLQTARNQLGVQEEELKVKVGCVSELKKKVGDQHLEIQELFRGDAKKSNELSSVNNELQSTKQSVIWYKQRLQESRDDRSRLSKEVSVLKFDLTTNNNELDILRAEIDDWKYKYRELSILYERDKNYYCLEAEKMKSAVTLETNTSIRLDDGYGDEEIRHFYEKEVAELDIEMVKVRKAIDEQGLLYDKVVKANAELLSRNTTLQKVLNDKELQLQIGESSRVDLNHKLDEVERVLRSREGELLKVTTDVEKMRVNLSAAILERDDIAKATVLIRNDFQKFLNLHNSMKTQLEEKNRSVLGLQKDKQELFMQNNWSVCEIEEYKQKEKEYLSKIGALSHENVRMKHNVLNLEKHAENLCSECDRFKSENEVLKVENIDYNDKVGYLVKDLDRLKEYTSDCEHKVSFYKKSIESLNSSLKDSEDSLQSSYMNLEDEKKQYRFTFFNIIEILCQKFDIFIQKDSFDLTSMKDIYRNNNLNNNDVMLDDILLKLDAYLVRFNDYINNHRKIQTVSLVKITNEKNRRRILKEEVYERIKMLENRSFLLTEKCLRTENAFCKLESIFASGKNKECVSEAVLNLQAAIKVKDKEMIEKQKRYEVNNRTLLRKIKEHMRGRNSAEKQCKYLQELYNSTIEALNSAKLQISEHMFKVDSQQKTIENKERALEKLHKNVANLQLQLSTNEVSCTGCTQNETLRAKISEMELKLVSVQNSNDSYLADIRAKEMTVSTLKQQLNEVVEKLEYLQELHSQCQGVRIDLHNEIDDQRSKSEQLQGEIDAVHQKYESLNLDYSNINVEKSKLMNSLNAIEIDANELRGRNEYFSREIEMLNCSLLQKDEEIDSLMSQKTQAKTENTNKESRLQELLSKSEQDLKDMHGTLKLVNGEKYFLQRLSNDLKIALNITLKQNQTLKDRLSGSNHETDFRSLPEFLSNIPGPSNYDDTRIKNLVKITENLEKRKPLTNLHESLNSLKREMATLQQQITEKKYVASSL